MRFRQAQHLKRTAQFAAVRTHGRRRDCGAFLLHLRETAPLAQEAAIRDQSAESSADSNLTSANAAQRLLGVVASKRVGNAIARNRAKRLMRETFRAHQDALPAHCEVVMTARRAILASDLATCERRFCAAIHQLRQERKAKSTAPEVSSS